MYVDPTWEYKCLVRMLPEDALPDEAEFNGLGAEGWGLVGAVGTGNTLRFCFKRSCG